MSKVEGFVCASISFDADEFEFTPEDLLELLPAGMSIDIFTWDDEEKMSLPKVNEGDWVLALRNWGDEDKDLTE